MALGFRMGTGIGGDSGGGGGGGSTVNDFILGNLYTFGTNGYADIKWYCVGKYENYVVLHSTCVTSGQWIYLDGTTRVNKELQDIHDYNDETLTLFEGICTAEKTLTGRGSGLYWAQKSDYNYPNYATALRAAVQNAYNMGAQSDYVWAGNGESVDSYLTWRSGGYNYNRYGIPLCFNLDPSKVTVDENNVITVYKGDHATLDDFDYQTVYTFGKNNSNNAINWKCVEKQDDYVVLVMQEYSGSTGKWPGYVMTGPTGGELNEWGSANAFYNGDISGENISGYNSLYTAVYQSISRAEKTNAQYGNGLYLVGTNKVGTETRYDDCTDAQKVYRTALKTQNTSYPRASLGTNSSSSSMYVIAGGSSSSDRTLSTQSQDSQYSRILPAFNLDITKVHLDSASNRITII